MINITDATPITICEQGGPNWKILNITVNMELLDLKTLRQLIAAYIYI